MLDEDIYRQKNVCKYEAHMSTYVSGKLKILQIGAFSFFLIIILKSAD